MAHMGEDRVDEQFNNQLTNIGIRTYGKSEYCSKYIEQAFKDAPSKTGGNGTCKPDRQFFLAIDKHPMGGIPVMVEVKRATGKLIKKHNDEIVQVIKKKDGTNDYNVINNYAVNGALHYALAILDEGHHEEAIIIGVNGTKQNDAGIVTDMEMETYYVAERNGRVPKLIEGITPDDLSLFTEAKRNDLIKILDTLKLSDEELKIEKKKIEVELESALQKIHQTIYDKDSLLNNELRTNGKMKLFIGLCFAGCNVGNHELIFSGSENIEDRDDTTILNNAEEYLKRQGCNSTQSNTIVNDLKTIFQSETLWNPKTYFGGISRIHYYYDIVKEMIIPKLENKLHIDVGTVIMRAMNEWMHIDGDKNNDVVTTPYYVGKLMARLANVNSDSYIWDSTAGSGALLMSALEVAVEDAKKSNIGESEQVAAIERIKKNQLLGTETESGMYSLGVLNMMLAGANPGNLYRADANTFTLPENFAPNVFLLNPPYSHPGKGLVYVEKAINEMKSGRACVLIQESAGSGQATTFAKNILKKATLKASIKMPSDLFAGTANVHTAIFVFEIGKPHDEKKNVIFIDFSEDGYSRSGRKKSTTEVNLRDVDHAEERYNEIVSLIEDTAHQTEYYTEANGKFFKTTITLNGNDWTFAQHQKIDNTPTEEDFKNVVADYLSWKITNLMKYGA